MHPVTRRRLLGVAGLAAAPLLTGVTPAFAGLPAPTPTGDDEGFLSFLAAGDKVLRDLYGKASEVSGFDAAERRRIAGLIAVKRTAILRVTAPLGADAPQPGDFDSRFSSADLATRAGVLALAEKLERLVCGVEVYGVAYAADPATRLLLGRLLASDAQSIGVVRALAGKAPSTGLLTPVDPDAAGDVLDRYLTSPTAPQESS